MKINLFFSVVLFLMISFSVKGQNETLTESDLKEKADELFSVNNFVDAKPLYAQLLSLYPKDPEYNFKYGTSVLLTEPDKQKPLRYLEFATSKSSVDPLAFFYLGKAHHLNYEFAKAVKYYSRYKTKAKAEDREKYQIDRQIEMAKNGNTLLSKLNEVQVIERQEIAEKDFYRIYKTDDLDGRVVNLPEEFMSKYDKKNNLNSVVFLPNNPKEVYFASYGKKGTNGKDIYKVVKLGNDSWSEPVSLGTSINTPFDEDFAFIHPNGKTLYFASKGHNSMGGYDLFKSNYDALSGQWKEPENLDFAFSSADDDIMFVTNKDETLAYFASNRSNEYGKITVYKVLTERAPADLSVIKGIFIVENTPENQKATITVIDQGTKELVGKYTTDEKGNYTIEIPKNGGEFKFNIETTADAPIHTGVVSVPSQDEFEVLGQELRLVGNGESQQLVIKNIFDGTTAQNTKSAGPKVSAETIRMKANLDVNYSESQLAQLIAQNAEEQANKENEQEIITGELPEPVINEDLNESESTAPVTENTESVNEAETVEQEIEVVSTSKSGEKLISELDRLRDSSSKNLDKKQEVVNNQYAKGLELQRKADELLKEADELENSGASSVDVVIKKKQAGIKALEAAYATQVAQELEESMNEDLDYLNEIGNTAGLINSLIASNEMAEAELTLNNLKQEQKEVFSADDVIEDELIRLEESEQLLAKKINDYKAKRQSFSEEKAELEKQLSQLEKELDKASKKKAEEIRQSIDAVNLDLEDLSYQAEVSKKGFKRNQYAQKSLAIEKEQVEAAKNRLNSNTEQSTSITEEDKSQLIDQLKNYRDKDLIAYSENNDLFEDEIELLEVSSEVADSSVETEISEANETTENTLSGNESLEFIDEEYNAKLQSNETLVDADLKLASNIKVYDDWITALENKKVVLQKELDATTDFANSNSIQSEIDVINISIEEKSEARAKAANELTLGVSGQSSVVESSSPATETPTPSVTRTEEIDVSEVDALTIVKDDFTNFKFDQNYIPSTALSQQKLSSAKKALFEASQIAKQEEIARQSAYSLPSAQEREEAFTRANQLKKQSEQKQLEASKLFAEFNLQEYRANQAQIREANQFDERTKSSSLEFANLLAEEAETFYTTALEIRAKINEGDRLSKKEVDLQKAYDYEMLALKKQEEAKKKLNLVSKEITDNLLADRAGVKVENSGRAKDFVQLIDDQEVLEVVDASEANKRALNLAAEVETLTAELKANESRLNEVSDETTRDSLTAVITEQKEKRRQKINQAALYYEREEQIKNGFVNISGAEPAPESKVLEPRKATIITQYTIDTVDITDARRELILNSKSFTDFAANRENLAKQLNIVNEEYQKATDLTQENLRLKKQAIVETNAVKVVADEEEKQRLIKSAQVINLTISNNEKKIDSLNRIIKVKNFLIEDLEQKDRAALTALSEIEKREYQGLTANYIPQEFVIEADPSTIESSTTEEVAAEEELTSNETSEVIEDLTPLNPEVTEVEPISSTEPTLIENSEEEKENEVTQNTKEPKTVNEELIELEEKETPIIESKPKTASTVDNLDAIPRKINKEIFIKLSNSESAYDDKKPIPTKTTLPEGIVYKVQVGAFRNPIPQDLFKGFAPLMAEKTSSGITRYTAGFFNNENSAIRARNSIRSVGYPDAFVVAFKNGERISITAARQETGEEVADSAPAVSGTITQPSPKDSESNNNSDSNSALTEGGSKELLSSEFNNSEVEAVVNTETIKGLIFTVQIGVFSQPVKKGTFDYDNLNVVQISDNLYRYNAGLFKSVLEAADEKNKIANDIEDAFITAYYNGKRITLEEAVQLKK